MRLKYKKIVILTTMFTMGISLLTFSFNNDKDIIKSKENTEANQEQDLVSKGHIDNSIVVATNNIIKDDLAHNVNHNENDDVTPTPEPTPEPTPTPFPVYELEIDAIPEINELIAQYFVAKINCDVDKIKELLSNSSKAIETDILQKETEHIEDFRNIKVYTKPSILEGSYIAYVYHEVKFTSINTLAPGLSKFYIVTDENNDYKIFSGELEDEIALYNIARNDDEDVVKLIKKTKKNGEEAKKNDQDLAEFWSGIDELANKKAKDDKADD
ncbi:MAG TPA: hypothetical protein GXZ90_01440 [Clostridiales bacterium]|nr:hypothetical protein [Clostridiales bacterium]